MRRGTTTLLQSSPSRIILRKYTTPIYTTHVLSRPLPHVGSVSPVCRSAVGSWHAPLGDGTHVNAYSGDNGLGSAAAAVLQGNVLSGSFITLQGVAAVVSADTPDAFALVSDASTRVSMLEEDSGSLSVRWSLRVVDVLSGVSTRVRILKSSLLHLWVVDQGSRLARVSFDGFADEHECILEDIVDIDGLSMSS